MTARYKPPILHKKSPISSSSSCGKTVPTGGVLRSGDGISKNIVSKRSYRGVEYLNTRPVLLRVAILGNIAAGFRTRWAGTQGREINARVLLETSQREGQGQRGSAAKAAWPVFTPYSTPTSATTFPLPPLKSERRLNATLNLTASLPRQAQTSHMAATGRPTSQPEPHRHAKSAGAIQSLRGLCGNAGPWMKRLGPSHPSRLNREIGKRFGDKAYAMEELIAETSSALTCVAAGVIPEPRAESAKYLNNWVEAMREDKRIVVSIFSKAQAAADFILQTAEITPAPRRPDFSTDPHPPAKEM